MRTTTNLVAYLASVAVCALNAPLPCSAGIVVDPVTGFQTYVPDAWQPPPNWNQPLQPLQLPQPKTTTICWRVGNFLNCETQ